MTGHLIVAVHGQINVVPCSVYHLLPDRTRWRVEVLASCPTEAKARWVRAHLPQVYDVGEVIRGGANAQRS